MDSTHLKNISQIGFSQIGSFPQVGVNKKHIWNHYLNKDCCPICNRNTALFLQPRLGRVFLGGSVFSEVSLKIWDIPLLSLFITGFPHQQLHVWLARINTRNTSRYTAKSQNTASAKSFWNQFQRTGQIITLSATNVPPENGWLEFEY